MKPTLIFTIFFFFFSLLFLMDHLGTIGYNLQITQSGEKPWSKLWYASTKQHNI